MIVFSPKENIGDEDPGFWVFLAMSAMDDATAAMEKNRPLLALLSYHGAIEKLLKGLCAKRGTLIEVEEKHNLELLAKRACVFDLLDEQTKLFIKEASTLHVKSSYPRDRVVYNALSESWYVKLVSNCTILLFPVLQGFFDDDTMHDIQGEDRQ